ncbi:MAG TPA: LytR family transcriptional regulator, partial [Armatimonadetes bacterium]|nr:LytR family transcriptional regulator [Armatimonadota bacterium]
RSERKAYLLSIPRDTAVIIDRYGLLKINAAHVYGGPEGLIKVLRDQLCINVEYYVRTSFEGFIKIVDAIGGVKLYVEKDMDYDDNWGNLHIHLKKGWQVLDGDKAHQYVRFRHDREGDIGRTRRQRKFLQAVARKLMSPSMLPRLPKLIRTTYQYVETNMSIKQLLSLAAFAEQLGSERIETATLPGRPVAHFWLPNRNEARELLSRMLGETFGRYSWDIQLAAIENRVRTRLVKRRKREKATPTESEGASSEAQMEMPIVPMVTELPSDWLMQSVNPTDLPTVAPSSDATNPNLEANPILHPHDITPSGSITSDGMQSAPVREEQLNEIAPTPSPGSEPSTPKPAEPHKEETEDAQM